MYSSRFVYYYKRFIVLKHVRVASFDIFCSKVQITSQLSTKGCRSVLKSEGHVFERSKAYTRNRNKGFCHKECSRTHTVWLFVWTCENVGLQHPLKHEMAQDKSIVAIMHVDFQVVFARDSLVSFNQFNDHSFIQFFDDTLRLAHVSKPTSWSTSKSLQKSMARINW